MKLPKQAQPIMRNPLAASRFSEHTGGGISPQIAVPPPILQVLQEWSIALTGSNPQCFGVVAGILNSYSRCLDEGRSSEKGCATIAARHIRDVACKSYCDCS